jgi:hypothetical protein
MAIRIRRREFIATLDGAATIWPLTAREPIFRCLTLKVFVVIPTNCDRSTSSNAFTLKTAYRVPSIVHVTTGITPQVAQT